MASASRRDDDSQREDAREQLHPVHATYVSAGIALLTVVLLTILGGCGETGGTAVAGIAAVGTIMTAAFGVAAVYARRNGR
ncbi:hypothetical protein SAMN05443287_107310 [Micromonospora phaseoli]|uniref:Uncharacterized protein n=1 Tax=Micromonospora phaseoli TaxID=1144548 RepID=A0A1H7BSN9_9ACTN|nr:hypothetical protein [Micromonospora phaseoli]PZV94918.1 hypothetical protein CLV64_10853 [Micromonospora phaseoli]GIJ79763.1 hypothetical protein Xph01_41950 [Micromonospora phaseoli]SEJ77652.1 hypothetical protein SAMN05443287_107310 [Micromonospora phaseoli]